MREIPMPPDNRSVAEQAALDAARNDGGLRTALANAMWRRDYQPSAEAQIGGFVYEIADRVARVVEERDCGVVALGLRDAADAAEAEIHVYGGVIAHWLRQRARRIEQEATNG